jgi:hypothetical protein
MQYFDVPSFDWFPPMFSSRLMLGSVVNASLDPTAFPYHGSISCLQLFTSGVNVIKLFTAVIYDFNN